MRQRVLLAFLVGSGLKLSGCSRKRQKTGSPGLSGWEWIETV